MLVAVLLVTLLALTIWSVPYGRTGGARRAAVTVRAQQFGWSVQPGPGTYEMLCLELCGFQHHTMRGLGAFVAWAGFGVMGFSHWVLRSVGFEQRPLAHRLGVPMRPLFPPVVIKAQPRSTS